MDEELFKLYIMKTINYFGAALGLVAIGLAWMWFGWKLPLVIFLALYGNNMERSGR
jgi:hypothetical protein